LIYVKDSFRGLSIKTFSGGTMNRRSLLVLGLVVILMSVVPAIGAAPEALDLFAIADDTAHVADTANPFLTTETNLWVGGSKVLAGDPCLEQLETFLKFDLSSVPSTERITAATLTLKSNGSLTGSTELTMALYGSASTSWSEGSGQIASWLTRPAATTDLKSSVTGITPAGTAVVFATSTEFAGYLEAQRVANVDKYATLVIVATACNAPASRQYLSSKETTGTNAYTPKLTLTTEPINAVTMSTFRPTDSAVNWPLIVGLAAVMLVVVGGFVVTRKRATNR
jgi:hypothetical protein